jgi:hypothetical protein
MEVADKFFDCLNLSKLKSPLIAADTAAFSDFDLDISLF